MATMSNKERAQGLSGSATAVEVTDLVVDYGRLRQQDLDRRHTIDGVSVTVRAGRFCSIIGASGCGKSTLLRTLAGLQTPTAGTVRVLGEQLKTPQPDRVGMVFQDASLLPWLTAAENVAFPLRLHGIGRASRRAVAERLLELVGLGEACDLFPSQLSGGMRQRVSIARSLALDPPVLLMDEPFGALDERTRETMGDSLLAIWEQTKKTIVFVTHSISEAIYLSDVVCVLSTQGRLLPSVDVTLGRPRRARDRRTEQFTGLCNTLRERLEASFHGCADAE